MGIIIYFKLMKFGLLALLGATTATPQSGLSMLSVMDTIVMDDYEGVEVALQSCVSIGDCSREEIANPRLFKASLTRGIHMVNMDHQAAHPPAVNAYENCLRKNKMRFSACTSLYSAAIYAGLVKVLKGYEEMVCIKEKKDAPPELSDLTVDPFKTQHAEFTAWSRESG